MLFYFNFLLIRLQFLLSFDVTQAIFIFVTQAGYPSIGAMNHISKWMILTLREIGA